MTDLTKPKYCNQAQCKELTYIALVRVRSCSGTRVVPYGSVCELGRGGRLTNRLKRGVHIIEWLTWCLKHWEEYQETGRLKNLQAEMVV